MSWKDVVHFYNVDSNTIKSASKLSLDHIYPNNFQKMKVNLATQVLSRTVVAGMRTLHKSGKLNSSKAPTFLNTAEYLELFIIYSIFLIAAQIARFLYVSRNNYSF